MIAGNMAGLVIVLVKVEDICLILDTHTTIGMVKRKKRGKPPDYLGLTGISSLKIATLKTAGTLDFLPISIVSLSILSIVPLKTMVMLVLIRVQA